jgi:RND family efflux transporter MFP subunit
MLQTTRGFIRRKALIRLGVLILLTVIVLSGAFYFRSGGKKGAPTGATYKAFRGPMEIAVLEGGSIEAKESLQVQCEVQGQTRILKLIKEGYQITQKDVEEGLILIELDSKDLLDKQLAQELEFQNSSASLTDAIEQYDIQLNQNESDIKAGELLVHFARMDLEKFLGASLTETLLKELGLDAPPDESREKPLDSSTIDFSQYAHPDKLGDGEARQTLRQLENELELAQEDVGLADTKLEGSKRLFDKEFITKTQLDTDQNAYNRKVIALQSAETKLDLFIKYEFVKSAQKYMSEYEESLRKLQRTLKLAHSKEAQSRAQKNSAEARHQLQTRKREDLATQIEKCIIRAPKTGLVVYGTGEQSFRSETIEEGATVRERQVLITIPDTSVMAVRLQVHESFVKKVKPGQKARIRVDAFPGELLTGEVQRIAVVPDSQNRWLNPDQKVYRTLVNIDGEYDWLKPGMSAEAEIITNVLANALQVPMHAVHLVNDRTVCYVATLFGVETRPVKTGEYNISFIEIQEGLEAGESVLLQPPRAVRAEKEKKEEQKEGSGHLPVAGEEMQQGDSGSGERDASGGDKERGNAESGRRNSENADPGEGRTTEERNREDAGKPGGAARPEAVSGAGRQEGAQRPGGSAGERPAYE